MIPWRIVWESLRRSPLDTARRGAAVAMRAWRQRQDRRRSLRQGTYVCRDLPPIQSTLEPIAATLLHPEATRIAEAAHEALAHRFNLLGSGPVRVRAADLSPATGLEARINASNRVEAMRRSQLFTKGYEPIDWSRDFVSGHRWPESQWHGDLVIGETPGVEIKIPWDLSRMHHLTSLAWAFVLAKSGGEGFSAADVYRDEVRNQILDFSSQNPPGFGVNWACTMDVGIRVANWLTAYDILVAHGSRFDAAFEATFAMSVYEHGQFIAEHLEWSDYLRANHYLADLVGLLFAGAATPGAEGDSWLRFAAAEFIREFGLQFHEEGSNFEASTSYHRLCTEMAFHAFALLMRLPAEKRAALRSDDKLSSFRPGSPPAPLAIPPEPSWNPVPDWAWKRLAGAGQFLGDVTRPDGQFSQIGDNDRGRFLTLLPCDERFVNDGRPLCQAIEALAANGGVPASVEAQLLTHWFPGRSSIPAIAESDRFRPYPGFGVFLYRRSRLWLLVRCGPNGQNGHGGHAHNDQLSFELAIDGIAVIVDPGTYSYTSLPDERIRFRSTAMHNTLILGDREQNPWRPAAAGLFHLYDAARPRVVEASPERFVGEQIGFGPVHRRTLEISDAGIRAIDECAAVGQKRVAFHLDPNVRIVERRQDMLLLDAGGRRVILRSNRGPWIEDSSWYSPSYGERVPTRVCRIEFSENDVQWSIEVLDS